jgi:hypothetical protein
MLALLLAATITTCPARAQVSIETPPPSVPFRREHPYPGGPDIGSRRRCRGYIIDHICPLACCGLDAPQNMQWQTKAQSKKTAGSCAA